MKIDGSVPFPAAIAAHARTAPAEAAAQNIEAADTAHRKLADLLNEKRQISPVFSELKPSPPELGKHIDLKV